jgi:hypothetical protein
MEAPLNWNDTVIGLASTSSISVTGLITPIFAEVSELFTKAQAYFALLPVMLLWRAMRSRDIGIAVGCLSTRP